jgi:uncharacterized protein (TIGR00369 family)
MTRDVSHLGEVCAATPYCRTIGVIVQDVVPGRARLHLPFREDNGNRNGTLHGGVLASLIDVAGELAARSGIEDRAGLETSTVDLSVHYLAAAVREGIAADAVVLRRGRVITFVEVALASDAGKPIARGLVAWRAAVSRRPGERAPAASPSGCAADSSADNRHAAPDVPAERLASARPSGSPFSARLGVRVAQLGPGRSVAVLPAQEALADANGRVHEGALAALVDCAGGAAAWSIDGCDPRAHAATIGMHLGFGVTTRGEDVVATASTAWQSGGIFVNTVTLSGRHSGLSVGTGSVTYRIARPSAA